MPHLQLKDIPVGVHVALRLQASASGVSMREYVLRLIEADLGEVDSREQMRRRMGELPRAQPGESAVALLSGLRNERDDELLARAATR